MNSLYNNITQIIAGFRGLLADKTLRRNFFSQGIGQFLGRLLFYLFFLYTARMLGAEAFGTFSLALSIGYLVYSVMEFGLDTVCVRSVARQGNSLLPSIFSARILTTLFGLMIILVISGLVLREDFRLTLALVGAAFVFFSFFNFFCSYFRGIEEMQYEAALLIFQRAGILILAVLIFLYYKTAPGAALAFLFSTLLAVLVAGVIFKNKGASSLSQNFKFKKDEWVTVLKMAFPLALAGSVWSVYYRIDNIMIAGFRTISEVGIYSGAYKLSEGIILFARVIMLVAFPKLSRLGVDNGPEFYVFFNVLFWILIVCAVIICSLMYFISEPLIIMALGNQYSSSVSVFNILLLSVLLMFPGYLVTHALIALDLQHLFMYVVIASATANILFNFFMIPAFGIKGAAWATVCSDILMTTACGYFLFRKYKRISCASG